VQHCKLRRSRRRPHRGYTLFDQIALNFRADPFNDLVVQELAGCQFILFDSNTQIPHQVGQTIDVRAKRPVYIGRPESASPATGSARTHVKEQADLVDRALTIS